MVRPLPRTFRGVFRQTQRGTREKKEGRLADRKINDRHTIAADTACFSPHAPAARGDAGDVGRGGGGGGGGEWGALRSKPWVLPTRDSKTSRVSLLHRCVAQHEPTGSILTYIPVTYYIPGILYIIFIYIYMRAVSVYLEHKRVAKFVSCATYVRGIS